MAASEPIRCKKLLWAIAKYWLDKGNLRNYALIVLGAYTALRISDLLKLTWSDVYDVTRGKYHTHIILTEKKTGKQKKIALNRQVIRVLKRYFPKRYKDSNFIFSNYRKDGNAITRVQAWRVVKEAAWATENIKATTSTTTGTAKTNISPHSLRKTLGYFLWKSGVLPVIIMDIYNHSSYQITKRYLGITQDDRDEIYLGVKLFNFFIFLGLMLTLTL